MPAATLNFSAPINVSCQVGDTVYYVSTTTSGGFDINSGSVIEIGEIREIQNATTNTPAIIANTNLGYNELNGLTDKFILFSKNNCQEFSSMLGYYGLFKFRNTSTERAELFNVTVDAFESSK